MPNRILKESICSSDSIDQLSAFQEIFFYRLIVNCDDYGRMDARPKILASRLFPLKDLRTNQIEDALRALTSAELVILYEVDGKPFLQMKTWDRHQQVRARKSKYPSADDGICKQMISDDIKCPRNPIQSESNPNPNPNPKAAALGASFDRFWAVYPRHEGKQTALKAFSSLNPSEELLQTMIQAIEKQKCSDQWKKGGGQYIPHPASWIRGKRWEDEPLPGKILPAQDFPQRSYDNVQAEMMEKLTRDVAEFKAKEVG